MQDESLAIRNAATILFRVLGGKENMDKIWPLVGNDKFEDGIKQPTKEWWEQMKKSQATIDKKLKDGRSIKN